MIRNSIDKPPYKEKLRMRSYGVPSASDTVFLEIKKKYNGVVYKRRSVFSLNDAQAFMNGQLEPKCQIERELAYTISFYDDILPSVYISYDRTSFCGVDDPHFRLTFDNNLIYREQELSLDKGIWGEKLLDSGVYIMEVKFPNSMPLWFSDILDEMKIFPTTYSKYGTIYSLSESFKRLRDLDFSTDDNLAVRNALSRAVSVV